MNWLEDRFKELGSNVAAYENGRGWTYAEILQEKERLKNQLSCSGIPPFACIAVEDYSIVKVLAGILAISELELIVLPIMLTVSEEEIHKQKSVAGVSWTLRKGELVESIQTQILPSPLIDELADRKHSGLILFSSGTSGEPKGMLHDLNELLLRYRRVKPRSDSTIQLLLPDHIGGIDSAFRTWLSGSIMVVPKERTPDGVGSAVETYSANILPATPTFFNLLLLSGVLDKYNFSSLEILTYGAEPMPLPLLASLSQAFPKVDLQQKFGTSETGTVRVKGSSNESLNFIITDADVEWQVLDSELWIKTPSRILGYLNADNSSLEKDGWYRTGDLVDQAADGSIRIIGRASAMINVGGLKVHPSEVETVLAEIQGIQSCQVFGKATAVSGNQVACQIIVSENHDLRMWKQIIRRHCRGRLAPWKIPSTVEIISEVLVTDRLKHLKP
ncbi:MAG: fatty acid--CoA ligase family protein [Verrucomicrobiota bacterium]